MRTFSAPTLEPTRAAAGSPTPSAKAPMHEGNFPKHTLRIKSEDMYQVPLLMLCCSPTEGGGGSSNPHANSRKKQVAEMQAVTNKIFGNQKEKEYRLVKNRKENELLVLWPQ